MPASPGERFMRIRSDGESLLSGAARRLSKIRIPFKSPSLLDRSAPYFSGIKRFGISKFQHYWQDPFHTLLNLPWGRFIIIFFLTYLIEFMVFAFLFWAQSDRCVIGMEGKFAHALWMSSRTASTLGYDAIQPNPACTFTNLTVMLQVIASSLVNFIMLGLVFARFSAPFKRASTIRFSAVMVAYPHPSGHWCLSLRVANIRKHQILKPSVRMVLTAVDSITPSNYLFDHLEVEARSTQETNLELGFPANLTHVITPSSPLYNLSLLEMDTRMMEILVFVDGIDAMTSKNMSARHAYNTSEVHMNEQFQPLHLEMRGGSLGLDFSGFDATTIASVQLLSDYNADPGLAERPLPEVQSHMWHLRHMTFKRLTERENLAGAPGRAPGGDPRPASFSDPTTADSIPGGGPAPSPGSLGTLPYRTGTPSPPPGMHSVGGGAAAAATTTGGPFTPWGDDPLGSVGGGSLTSGRSPAAPSPVTNPFLPHSSLGFGNPPPGAPAGGSGAAGGGAGGAGGYPGGGGGGGGSNRNSGGGSTWMGFGVPLQPSVASTSGAGAGMGMGLGSLPPSRPAPGPPPTAMPISAFINSSQSGLESFADMPPPAPSGGFTSVALGSGGGGGGHHLTPQRSWLGGGGTVGGAGTGAGTSPQTRGLASVPLSSLGGQGSQGHPGATAGAGLEMLPTSSPAVEPRVNGTSGGGGR